MAWNLLWGDSLAFDVNAIDVPARMNAASASEGYTRYSAWSWEYNNPIPGLSKTLHLYESGSRFTFPVASKTWLYRGYLWMSGEAGTLLSFRDGATEQCSLVETGGALQLRRGTTILLATPPYSTGFHHVDIAVSIGTSGSACIRVDYMDSFPLSGINTQTTGNAFADSIIPMSLLFPGGSASPTVYWANPTFMASLVSNCLTELLPPSLIWYPRAGSGNGAHQDLIASAGSAYTCINGLPPDDTKFISSGTPDDVSTFTHDALTGLSCRGYIPILRGKVLSGGALVAPVTGFGGVVYPGANVALSTAFVTVPTTPVVVRPDNGMPISVADANATELGVKIIGVA